jgi:hypothetical protein
MSKSNTQVIMDHINGKSSAGNRLRTDGTWLRYGDYWLAMTDHHNGLILVQYNAPVVMDGVVRQLLAITNNAVLVQHVASNGGNIDNNIACMLAGIRALDRRLDKARGNKADLQAWRNKRLSGLVMYIYAYCANDDWRNRGYSDEVVAAIERYVVGLSYMHVILQSEPRIDDNGHYVANALLKHSDRVDDGMPVSVHWGADDNGSIDSLAKPTGVMCHNMWIATGHWGCNAYKGLYFKYFLDIEKNK